MMYQLPKYVVDLSLNKQKVDYFWDDDYIDQKLNYDYASQFIERMENSTLRAKIALSIGVYEWVLGRFNCIHQNSVFYQIAEAAWCSNIDKRYLQYFELDCKKYRGPVNYALWLAYAALYPVLLVSENISDPEDKDNCVDPLFMYDKNEWQDCLSTLLALLKHILPAGKLTLFEDWFNLVIERLTTIYIQSEESAFTSLFGHRNEKDWLGDYVARESLDPIYNYRPEHAVPLLNNFLSQVDKSNPFLRPLSELETKLKTPFKMEY